MEIPRAKRPSRLLDEDLHHSIAATSARREIVALCRFRTPRDNGYTQSRSLGGRAWKSRFWPTKGDEPYVFVCYAHEDDDLVYPEIAWLHEQGINIWYDEGVSPGKEWSEELGRAIDNWPPTVRKFGPSKSLQDVRFGIGLNHSLRSRSPD
jgi:hypothetical protein